MRVKLWMVLAAAPGVGAIVGGPQSPRVPTYTEDIAPIFAKKCVVCHVSGGTGPFPLDRHSEVFKRAELVRTVALSRIMPPYVAETDFGSLGIVPQLTDEEALTLQKWVLAKCPEGSRQPSIRQRPTGKIDKQGILELYARDVPKVKPEGTPYWRGLLVPIPRGAKGFVQSLAIVPNSPNALRYAVAYLLPKEVAASVVSGKEVTGGEVEGKHLIGVWAPGCAPFKLPKGLGFALGSGSVLYVRAHYAPTGRTLDGGFRVSLGLVHDPKTVPPAWLTLGRKDFLIQANATPTWAFSREIREPTRVIAVLPEARFYATSVRLMVAESGKPGKRLFETNRWNPYWVANYQFQMPPALPSGSDLIAEISYANDPKCSMNEGKTPQPVRSGPRLQDEMCWVHVLTAPTERRPPP